MSQTFSEEDAQPATFAPRRRLLASRVLTAQLINELGSGVTAVALPLLIYGTTGSVTATGIVAITGAAPAVLFGLIGGAHADRANRQHLIVWAALAVGCLLMAVPIAYSTGGIALIAALNFLTRTLMAFANPAMRASLPVLFADDLQDFFGKRTGLTFLAQTIGPALGGALVGLVSAQGAIVIDGASYIAFALIIATISGFDPGLKTRAPQARAAKTLQSIRDGISHTRTNPVVCSMLGFWFVSLAALPIALLAAVPYITHTLHQSSAHYGVAVSCYAAASLLSSWIAGKVHFIGGARRWLLASGIGYGVVNVAMISHPGYIVFCLLWLAWGLAYGPEEVVGQVAFARAIPEQFQGRVYSLMSIVLALSTIVGTAVAGPLTDHLGPTTAMFVAGIGFLGATLGFFSVGPAARALQATQLDR